MNDEATHIHSLDSFPINVKDLIGTWHEPYLLGTTVIDPKEEYTINNT